MLLFPNALCCSLYERNCVCAVTKIFTKFLPANNFCQLLRVTRKRSCTSAVNTQAQLHFRDDQQRAFGISNISNWILTLLSACLLIFGQELHILIIRKARLRNHGPTKHTNRWQHTFWAWFVPSLLSLLYSGFHSWVYTVFLALSLVGRSARIGYCSG